MAASSAGAVKAYIETLGLGIAAYRDEIGQNASLPYARIQEAITLTPRHDGDFGDLSSQLTATEEVQIDLWQQARNPATEAVVESYTLQDTLARKLHGAHLTAAPKRVFGVRLLNVTRFPEPDERLVRHTLTIALDRAL